MKAELKPRINLEGRTALEEAVPLATPLIVSVDPSSACNFQCRFCPTGDRQLMRQIGRWQGVLSLDLFEKLIADLAEFEQPLKVLRLYKDGEPLLNKRLPEMISLARHANCAGKIDTTTNASLLTPELATRLVDAGLDRINISIDGLSDQQYWEFTQTKVRFEEVVANVKFFYENRGRCEVAVKTMGEFLDDEEKASRFFETFGNISDRIFVEYTSPCWPGFDVEKYTGVDIQLGIFGNPIGDVEVCPYIFYSLAINADGTVSLCSADWERTLVIGDLRKESLRSIWDGDVLRQHQLAHLGGHRADNDTCAACRRLSHALLDNIDPYAGVLLDRLTTNGDRARSSAGA